MIADSLVNLRDKGLILAPEDDPHIASELKTQGAELKKKGTGAKKKAEPAKQKAKLKEEEGVESGGSEGEESDHKKSRLEPLVDDKD